MKVKIFSVLFVAAFFMLFMLTGSLEQDMLTLAEYLIYSVATVILLIVSGRKAGLLKW
jgi:hypothetical protein